MLCRPHRRFPKSGKARSYLETVIAIRPPREAYQVYGQLLNQLGDSEAAADASREGLFLTSGSAGPDVPRIGSSVRNVEIGETPKLVDGGKT